MFKSIRTRLNFAFISLAIGPILVVGLIISYASVAALKEEAIAHQQLEAERVSIAVENYVRELERILKRISLAHGFMSMSRTEQRKILEELLSDESRFEELTLIGKNGKELIRCNRVQVVFDRALKDRGQDPVFLQSMALHSNYFSPVQFNTVTGEPHMTIAVPLQSFLSGKTEYVLLGSARLKKIWDLLASISHLDQTIIIVDEAGNIIGHPDPSVTLSGQKYALPDSPSGIAAGLSGAQVVMATKRLEFGEQSIYIVAQKPVALALALARYIVIVSLVVVVISLVAAMCFSALIIANIVRPLQHLASVARNIQQGDLDQQADSSREDEVGELGLAFNEMTRRLRKTIESLEQEVQERKHEIAERKQAEAEKARLETHLRQAHKMEAVGTLAGGIAHDFNNMLGVIIGNADMVMDDLPPGDRARQSLAQVLVAANRAKELVRQILTFSRQTDQNLMPIKPCSVIKESLKLLRSTTPSTVSIVMNVCNDAGMIMADPTQFHQLVMNLFANAVYAMDEKGVLEVSGEKVALDAVDIVREPGLLPGQYFRLSVRDTGSGMDKETMERIFDPFYTTKDVHEGTGMGLSIVMGIVRSHGGMITVDSAPGQGTAFHLFFSVVDNEMLQQAEVSEDLPRGSERIIFIDDEKMLAEMGGKMLERQGYQVTIKTSSTEALETFKSDPDAFDLVITDQTMPDMSGAELAVELLGVRPDIPIILCTGYSRKISEEEAKRVGIKEFCIKPLERKQLACTVRTILDEANS